MDNDSAIRAARKDIQTEMLVPVQTLDPVLETVARRLEPYRSRNLNAVNPVLDGPWYIEYERAYIEARDEMFRKRIAELESKLAGVVLPHNIVRG